MTIILASVILNPGGWFSWLIVGLLAGAIAGTLVRGRGYGCLVDIVVGVVGAFIGGIVVGIFLPGTVFGFLGSLVVAVVGAVLLLSFVRLLSPGRA
ncbi:MAG TPA: GlsB/YeaQ/YmgE family stress response membrane protein [Candidatus Dormibacteraeota bacterium]